MKKIFYTLLVIPLCFLMSCNDLNPPESKTEKTLLIYMPWSSNLTSCFYQNIKDMEYCMEELGGLSDERVLVFISTSPEEAELFEIKYKKGSCKRVALKSYTNPALTTESGIAGILNDVISYAPAKKYSMIIGCHGMGWLPVDNGRASRAGEKYHWDYGGSLPTRYFGGTTPEYQTEIVTLSSAITSAGLKMEYILFDDCYMASIEVAYELRNVADYLIASTCEIMAYGMPYATMGKYLLGTPDYAAICDVFHEFYSNYSAMPCGTLSVTDLSQVERMAQIMKQINSSYTFDGSQLDELQSLDGYKPTVFYDFGDYVNLLLQQNNASSGLLTDFEEQLNRLVPYKTNTEYFYTASSGSIKINAYSGITTSDPSVNKWTDSKTNTEWYYATH